MLDFYNGESIFLYIFFFFFFPVEGNAIPTDSKACLKYYVGQAEGYIHVFVNEILCLYAHGNPNRLG